MLQLYNTLTRKKEEFQPLDGKTVRLYSCGPTVYNYAHIGNLRTYIFADVLRRTLEYNDYQVKQVMNITDVGHLTEDGREEDKIEAQARREKKSAWDIARFYEKVFRGDLKKLNIETPKFVRATVHIKDQIRLIEQLEKKGFIYKTSDGIYFDVARLPDYGKLSGQALEEKQAGARVALSGEKRNPQDFALWKFSYPNGLSEEAYEKKMKGSGILLVNSEYAKTRNDLPFPGQRQMEWPSPWGIGFPGWHIECSAMSVKYLGQPFDIHTGGVDHIGTHHTNEIAQSEAATGLPLARVWMHGEFLTVLGGRMGKSEGNLITLGELQKKGFSPLAYRYLTLSAHYRSKLNFTWESLRAAQNTLEYVYEIIREWDKPKIGCAEYEEKFLNALSNDLNTPECLAIFHELVNDGKYPTHARAQSLLVFDKVLGLDIKKYLGKPTKAPETVKKLVARREKARAVKDWSSADALRKKIEELGFFVEDASHGPKIRKLTARAIDKGDGL